MSVDCCAINPNSIRRLYSDAPLDRRSDYGHYTHNTRPSEVFYSREGPAFDSLFIEHKNVRGLTVRAEVVNLLDARHRLDRDVYVGRRTLFPLAFRQHGDELIGPLFDFKVSGNF